MTIKPEIEDLAFVRERARKEREAAAISENNAVAMIHLNLAEAYERRAIAIVEAREGLVEHNQQSDLRSQLS